MYSIKSIIDFMAKNLSSPDGRFLLVDDQHIMDTKTGVKVHLYDDTFKFTRDDKTILDIHDLTKEEQGMMWRLKQAITNPEMAHKRRMEKPMEIRKRREALSHLFENPTPDVGVQAEQDAVPYQG